MIIFRSYCLIYSGYRRVWGDRRSTASSTTTFPGIEHAAIFVFAQTATHLQFTPPVRPVRSATPNDRASDNHEGVGVILPVTLTGIASNAHTNVFTQGGKYEEKEFEEKKEEKCSNLNCLRVFAYI